MQLNAADSWEIDLVKQTHIIFLLKLQMLLRKVVALSPCTQISITSFQVGTEEEGKSNRTAEIQFSGQ